MTATVHYKTSDGIRWVQRHPMTIKAATRVARELLRKTSLTPSVTEVTIKRIDTTP